MFNNLVGCSSNPKEETISEVHKIYEIENGFVHGELVKGNGEGIYYSENQLDKEGISNIKIGDKIKFTWSKNDFENENWDEFDAERVD